MAAITATTKVLRLLFVFVFLLGGAQNTPLDTGDAPAASLGRRWDVGA